MRAALARLLGRDPTLGGWGERLAARHLARAGYRVLGRNVRTKMGELDLVALAPDARTLVVVEVKTRRTRAETTPHTPRPEDALTRAKRERLVRLARVEAKRRSMERSPLRIDVIAIEKPDTGRPTLRHHERAVTA
ncbi:MAG: YraN family protein [Planctomycetota bacterium]